jgi:hypothetical protein
VNRFRACGKNLKHAGLVLEVGVEKKEPADKKEVIENPEGQKGEKS